MRGPDRPNHYDDLRGAPAGRDAEEPGRDNRPQPSQPEPETPTSPLDAVEARIAARDAIYKARRDDNARLVAEKAAEAADARRQASAEEVEALSGDNAKKLVEQARAMHDVRSRFEALGQNPVDMVEERALHRSGGQDVSNDRYHRALAEQRDPNDPYATLERAAMAEHSAFLRDQQRLEALIKDAANADARHSLEQRKDIQAADHIAATSHRVADQSEIITGVRDNEDAVIFRERAAEYEARSASLQQNYRSRTGRSASQADWQGDADADWDRGVKERQASAATREQEAASQSPGKASASAEWASAGVDITDAKAERLAKLAERFGGGGAGPENTADGPTRPTGGDRGGR